MSKFYYWDENNQFSPNYRVCPVDGFYSFAKSRSRFGLNFWGRFRGILHQARDGKIPVLFFHRFICAFSWTGNRQLYFD